MDLTGRYLKYIGKYMYSPAYGDYFLITSMKSSGLLRLKDNMPNCYWTPDNYQGSFELMSEGFDPNKKELIYEIY